VRRLSRTRNGTEAQFCGALSIFLLGSRIDLLTAITGVVTDEAFQAQIGTYLEGLPVFILSKPLLIQNKRAVARSQDLADLDTLS